MIKIKFFTIDAPGKETLDEGSTTNYEINRFLNENDIDPIDISAEFNELSGMVLLSIAYLEKKSTFKKIVDLLKGRKGYEVRFETLTEYREKSHTVYIQLQLENAINYNTHPTISHGIFVENHIAKVVFLEYK